MLVGNLHLGEEHIGPEQTGSSTTARERKRASSRRETGTQAANRQQAGRQAGGRMICPLDVLHVDDLMVSGDGSVYTEKIIKRIHDKYPFGEWLEVQKESKHMSKNLLIVFRPICFNCCFLQLQFSG